MALLPPWARPLLQSKRLTSPLTVFVLSLVLSLVLTPSPSLYSPLLSPRYTPTAQPSPPSHLITTSIVIPTYKERSNLSPLVHAVHAALSPSQRDSTEIVVVDDDSADGTLDEVMRLQGTEEGRNVVLLTRGRAQKERGLSSAVLRGFEMARGENLVVMDADLQHPPSVIPFMLEKLGDRMPVVLGTRYGKGVEMDKDWPLFRRVISWGARILARGLTSASDPMTGFFAVRKPAFLKAKPLSSSGFKIALELLLAIPSASRPQEIPYSFGLRTSGSSKLGAMVMLKYVLQLWRLYAVSYGWMWHLFVAAAATGVVVGGKRVWALRRGRRGIKGREDKWFLPVSNRYNVVEKGKRRALE